MAMKLREELAVGDVCRFPAVDGATGAENAEFVFIVLKMNKMFLTRLWISQQPPSFSVTAIRALYTAYQVIE